MWWRYILAGVILTVPVFLYFGMNIILTAIGFLFLAKDIINNTALPH